MTVAELLDVLAERPKHLPVLIQCRVEDEEGTLIDWNWSGIDGAQISNAPWSGACIQLVPEK